MTRTATQGTASPKAYHPTRRTELPDHHAEAGSYLLAGIDTVLPRLMAPSGSPPVLPLLVDDLRAALAHTAACGDTCRVRAAADSIRLAANLLLEGSTEDAQLMLQRVRADLADRPHTG